MIRGIYVLAFFICSFASVAGKGMLQSVDTTLAHENLQKASDLKAKSLYDSSNVYLGLAAEEFQKNKIWHRFIYCQYNIGYNLSAQRRHQEALDHMLGIEMEYKDQFNPAKASTFGFYWQVAWAYFQSFNYTKALQYYDMTIDAMSKSEDRIQPYQHIKIMYDKGVIFQRLSQYDQALKLMEEALAKAEEIDYHHYDPYTLNNLGIIYRRLGEYERSLNFYERAFELAVLDFNENGYNLAGLCPFYVNFSSIYRELGDLDKSHEKVIEGLKVYHDNATHWRPVHSILKYNEIEVYFDRGEYDKALKESIYTLKYVSDKKGINLQTSGILRYLGRAYHYKNNLDSAEYYYREYLRLAGNERSFIEGNSLVHKDLAQLYWNQNRVSDALNEIQIGIKLLTEGFNSTALEDNPTGEDVIINYRNLLNFLSHKTQYLYESRKSDGV